MMRVEFQQVRNNLGWEQELMLEFSDDEKFLTVHNSYQGKPLPGEPRKYRLVDKVPYGYFIWNIGYNMPDGYLPLCRWAREQPYDFSRNVDVDTLCAIRCERSRVISDNLGRICAATLPEMVEYVQKHDGQKKHARDVAALKEMIRVLETVPAEWMPRTRR